MTNDGVLFNDGLSEVPHQREKQIGFQKEGMARA
jgi:hypothetical protein